MDPETSRSIALQSLALELISGKRVVFVTGAGLSVASGIPTYRSSKGSIWDKFVTSWGTRKKFLEDPLAWWNQFWLKTHETPTFLNAKPNPGHCAIAHIIQKSNTRLITQNIDRLHSACMCNTTKLVQVHGCLGYYKCVHDGCEYSSTRSIENIDLEALAVPGTSMEKNNLQLRSAPLCPGCNNPVMGQSLFFDEMYQSHAFYQWDLARQWLNDCEVMVFVGTSFSVGVTAESLNIAKKDSKWVYNFNMVEDELGCGAVNITGKAEETLPELYNYMWILAGKPRMFFYPLPSYGITQNSRKYGMPPKMINFENYHTESSKRKNKPDQDAEGTEDAMEPNCSRRGAKKAKQATRQEIGAF
mmetsp:Transcript_20574/g.28868  ORF Transcript_20574/g.28868 Transcript_20574/m.28868 type:complete len:359 (-) Transcript_20574:96-1172(-)|eukprot:CAMPEP_0168558848 /NCGR_PEP_ID=MMETSP0413-20121227/10200_1 /TAXON_ID=136452 /ORGANISM="Filamoeba nolandi, Strain NC-AS-23-1" /LENGTH=358 /DNA_ID=CAMNT_0008590019 /DNA_START=39 /DNA_END=1115 /DNA_ORIENTATION=-